MLPKNLLYQTKSESASARSYKANIAPQNGTGPYTPNQTIIINIPTSPNLVTAMSENYLKFDATFTVGGNDTNYIRLDNCGANSFIQRIRVFHGSVLLSDINNYNQLASMCYDLQVSTPAAYGKYNILTGSRNDTVVSTPTFIDTAVDTAAEIVTTLSNIPLSVNQVNSGIRIDTGSIATTATSTVHTFCLPLISIVGTLCPKYFPLFECTAFPLRVEIQLASSATGSLGKLSGFSPITLYFPLSLVISTPKFLSMVKVSGCSAMFFSESIKILAGIQTFPLSLASTSI